MTKQDKIDFFRFIQSIYVCKMPYCNVNIEKKGGGETTGQSFAIQNIVNGAFFWGGALYVSHDIIPFALPQTW